MFIIFMLGSCLVFVHVSSCVIINSSIDPVYNCRKSAVAANKTAFTTSHSAAAAFNYAPACDGLEGEA